MKNSENSVFEKIVKEYKELLPEQERTEAEIRLDIDNILNNRELRQKPQILHIAKTSPLQSQVFYVEKQSAFKNIKDNIVKMYDNHQRMFRFSFAFAATIAVFVISWQIFFQSRNTGQNNVIQEISKSTTKTINENANKTIHAESQLLASIDVSSSTRSTMNKEALNTETYYRVITNMLKTYKLGATGTDTLQSDWFFTGDSIGRYEFFLNKTKNRIEIFNVVKPLGKDNENLKKVDQKLLLRRLTEEFKLKIKLLR
ncbi:MAG: hypothetical protein ABSG15_14835 [FCB group bacterium]